ncbi:isopeptide-forming domain-containing fimbrial protein [Microbacterium sp. NPDC089987]|uniref:DUF7927 domain-containing protein n=1 Tax=Microbacterium sp. NPDC089987 TaxID=3364202 RepID=UPI00381F71B9
MIGGIAAASPVAAAAAEPFICEAGSVYVQGTDPGKDTTRVREFTVNPNGTPINGGTLDTSGTGLGADHQNNGLGISSTGRYAYSITNTDTAKYVAKHDRVENRTVTSARIPTSAGLDKSILRGAVHPITGVYYFASGTSGGGINLYAWDEKPATPTAVQVGTLKPASGSTAFGANGDMAFNASGQLLLVADHVIYSADLPSTGQIVQSAAEIAAKQVFEMAAAVKGNGIAFGNYGHIFVSSSANRIIEVDLARGKVVSETSIPFSPTDMASCTFPNTITLKKDLPAGRQAETDQFGLRIDAPAEYKTPRTEATTRGNAPGLQPDYAGPVFVNQGDTFTLSELASGTTKLDRYASSLTCEEITPTGTEPVAVSGSTVVQPRGELGTSIECAFRNTKLTPGLALRKTSDPASGAAVSAGQKITYTVEAQNTGDTVLNPVNVTDDLSAVLAHAEYQGDVKTHIDGTDVTSGAAAIDGTALAWTGSLQPAQAVTITYSVIVNDDVAGETIANRVTASGTPPGSFEPIVPPAVVTQHPVAGFVIDKTSNPASGTVVQPGEKISYTVTGTNTGATTLNPARISDDLSKVLAGATYNDDIVTTIGNAPLTSGAATVIGDELAWTGSLGPDATVTITYSVTVAQTASGIVISNTASGDATPTTPNPGDPNGPQVPGTPITPPTVTTEHPVIGSGFTISKSADPASGTAVEVGDTITYTVTGTNTGDTELRPAEIVDDLSAVLDDARYNDDVTASRGTAEVKNDKLTWKGTLPKGASVTIRYSVTVKAGVKSAVLKNSAEGSATPRIPTDPSDPQSPTTPGTAITPPPATTTHPVVDNGFTVSKSATPDTRTAVSAGDTVTYTVVGKNTGNTVLDPATLTDDLSAVLGSAQLTGDITASTGTAALNGQVLTWTGALAPGASVTLTYTVTVNDDATGVMLRNTVAGVGTPLIPADPTDPESPTTPGTPVTPPPASTEHPVVNPGFTIVKSADPASGTRVDPGSVIEYTVTGTNTGDTVLDPATISDNLDDALANAAYNGDIKASRGTAKVTGSALTWTGSLKPGDDVTITYSVTVDGDAGGETIRNSVTGSATPQMPADPSDPENPTTPGTPVVPPTVTTEHPVNTPGFTFTKTVDPAAGTAVDPGQVLTYTLTGVNTGQTALPLVEIADDLSGVLSHASYNNDAVAKINGALAGGPAVADSTLSWQGALAVGQTVVVTYSVTVGADAIGEVLSNSATGAATPPGGEKITPPTGTTTNPVNLPGFSVSKSADPAGGTVDPGSTITYTVTGANTGETALDPVTIVDDLSGVLSGASYNADATATINGAAAGVPAVADGELSWSGALAVGQTVTITYSVTVNPDAGGAQLKNSVSGVATPPGGVPPIETPPATTEHGVNEPGFSVTKTADPASGTRVDPGSVITYTVTGVNTGETALEPVALSDDVSGVLAHAVYNDDVTARIGEVDAEAPVFAEGELSWQGALAIGERVTITYSVTVNGDAGGKTLKNTVSGVAVPPGGAELTPPPATTENPVGKPGFTFAKTSNPASGTAIATGSTVTYSLTGVNTGETGLDQVVITDDLGKVLAHAKLTGDVVAVVGGREVAAPRIDGTKLSWSGALGLDETVTITYTVAVNDSAAGQTLKNVATASATAPGGVVLDPAASSTEHKVLTPLAITGGQLAPWALGLATLLSLGGAALMLVRRRRDA